MNARTCQNHDDDRNSNVSFGFLAATRRPSHHSGGLCLRPQPPWSGRGAIRPDRVRGRQCSASRRRAADPPCLCSLFPQAAEFEGAGVVKLADARDSNPVGFTPRVGSIPTSGTNVFNDLQPIPTTVGQASEQGLCVTIAVDTLTAMRPELHDYRIRKLVLTPGETGMCRHIVHLLAARRA